MKSTKEIMNIIEEHRLLKRMSIQELGDLTKTSRASIYRYKDGSREFPINKAHLFAEALGITTSQLLGINEVEDKSLGSIINQLNEKNRNALSEYAQFLLNTQNQDTE